MSRLGLGLSIALPSGSGDYTAPTVSSIVITDVDKNKIAIIYNENLNTGSIPSTGDFSLSIDPRSPSFSITAVSITGNSVILTLSRNITRQRAESFLNKINERLSRGQSVIKQGKGKFETRDPFSIPIAQIIESYKELTWRENASPRKLYALILDEPRQQQVIALIGDKAFGGTVQTDLEGRGQSVFDDLVEADWFEPDTV